MPKTTGLLIGLALLASTAKTEANAPGVPAKKADPVRKLVVNPPPTAVTHLSAKHGVTVVTDQKELADTLAELLGEAAVKQIAGQVDFAKDKLVHVAWGSSGPPFGTLQYEIKEDKEVQTITFYVKEPKVQMRGQAYRLGSDFFAVPKKLKVSFGGSR